MDKKVLTEINRTREIMGLGQLLREAAWNLGAKKAWADFLQTYKSQVFDDAETVRPDISGGYKFDNWARTLWTALKEKYGGEIMNDVDSNWKYMAWMLRPDMLGTDDGMTEDVVLQPLTQKQLKRLDSKYYSEGDLVINADGKFYKPAQFCRVVNKFNIANFGTTQITSWEYNKGDGETETNKEGEKEFLYQFSASRTSKTRKEIVTPGTPEVAAAEGEPIPGGSAFAVNEVIPDSTKIQELLTAIQAAATEGNTVTNVKINGVASEQVISNVATWKKNVGNEYNSMADADIVKLVTGDFTEPVTGNQVLAYLRAQNLGKELIKAGINVDSYSYSVGGDEMKADVMITTETPSVVGKKGTRTTELGVDTEDLTLDSKVLGMVISVPAGNPSWQHDSWEDKKAAKTKGNEVITSNKAKGSRRI